MNKNETRSWQEDFEEWGNTPDSVTGIAPFASGQAPGLILSCYDSFRKEEGMVEVGVAISAVAGCLWIVGIINPQSKEELDAAEAARIAQGGNPADNKWNF